MFLTKADAAGNLVWAKRFGVTGNNTGRKVILDASGNLLLAGFYTGTIVFDSGVNSTTLTNPGGSPFGFVAKLDGSGNVTWVTSFSTTRTTAPSGIATDAAGNVFVTGSFAEALTIDAQPDPYTLTTADQGLSIYVAKLDAAGKPVLLHKIGDGTSGDVNVDASGNVYLTGQIRGTAAADFDPGPGSFTLTSPNGLLPFVAKLQNSGSPVWVQRITSANSLNLAGTYVNGAGTVYVSGSYGGTIVAGSGPGSTTLLPGGTSFNGFIWKLTATGETEWAKRLGAGPLPGSIMTDIIADASGDVLVTGSFSGTLVVPTAPAATTLLSNGQNDILLARLDAGGNYKWVRGFGSTTGDDGIAIGQDATGNVYAAGYIGGVGPEYLFPESNFLMKLATISASPAVSASVVCAGTPVSLSVQATGGTLPYSYSWAAPAGITLPANTNTSALSGTAIQTASGLYTLTVTVAGSGSAPAATATISVSVNAQPAVTITGNPGTGPLTCANPSLTLTAQTTATALMWSSGGSTSQSLPVSQTGVYSVTATDDRGCQSVTSRTITADQSLPVVSIATTGSVLTCANPTLTLTAQTTATALVWFTGATTAGISVSVADAYSVTATGANGCTAVSQSLSVSQDVSLPFAINSVTVCVGQRFSLQASGCGSGQVLWSTGAAGSSLLLTAGSSNTVISATCTVGSCSATASGSVVIGTGILLPPASQILSLRADESACPVKLLGQGVGTTFVFTGPKGYVFSSVFRDGGTYDLSGQGVTQPGVYTLTGSYTTECGTSQPVTRTVAVGRSCP